MTLRGAYATGLAGAFILFGAACAAAVVPLVLLRGRPDRVFDFVTMWFVVGVPGSVVLACVVGPAVLAARRVFGPGFGVAGAAALGATFAPVLLFISWLIFRENNETFGDLLQFWARVPGELVIGLVPHAAASAFFASWLVKHPAQRKDIPT